MKKYVLLLFVLSLLGRIPSIGQERKNDKTDPFEDIIARCDNARKTYSLTKALFTAGNKMNKEEQKKRVLAYRKKIAGDYLATTDDIKKIDDDNIDLYLYAKFTCNEIKAYMAYFDLLAGFTKDGTDDIKGIIAETTKIKELLPLRTPYHKKEYLVDEEKYNFMLQLCRQLLQAKPL